MELRGEESEPRTPQQIPTDRFLVEREACARAVEVVREHGPADQPCPVDLKVREHGIKRREACARVGQHDVAQRVGGPESQIHGRSVDQGSRLPRAHIPKAKYCS